MKYACLLILFTFLSLQHSEANQIGFTQARIWESSDRPLTATFWYPTHASDEATLIADNVAFVGTRVIKDAPIAEQVFPLVLLSHGYRGNWRNQSWLAAKLVEKGYLVAAVDHPGTTTFNTSPVHADRWWERPRDLSRLLDWLFASSQYQDRIDAQQISAIGHSLGGWTVMLLAGADFDLAQYHLEYAQYPNARIESVAAEIGLLNSHPDPAGLVSLRDARIQRVVSFDLGIGRGFSTSSLMEVQVPVLLLAAGIDIGDLPQQLETGFVAEHLPEQRTQSVIYPEASHFSFMQPCKPGAVEILEEENKGDGILCFDGSTNRQTLHDSMFQAILHFLE